MPTTKPQNKISPIIVTYHKNLPNIRKAINNNWHILSINEDLSNIFHQLPQIAFHKNKSLLYILCKHKVVDNKLANKKIKIGRCKSCFTRNNNLCCKQMADTNYFTNRKTGKRFNILHNLNCKSKNLIYLIECTLCNFKPYIGKCETPSNLCRNNHRIDSTKENAINVEKHFSEPGHD